MKILIVNSNDNEGGAARSAFRLAEGLSNHNIETTLLVQNKRTGVYFVDGPHNNFRRAVGLLRPKLDRIPLYLYGGLKNIPWSTSLISNRHIRNKIFKSDYDIVNLHWINGGFLSINDVYKIDKPIIWTLHDSWPFTGGCHIPYDCDQYRSSCSRCPQLNSSINISKLIFKQKKKLIEKNITVVTPSNWLANKAKESYLFKNCKIQVIPNGLNTKLFKPIAKVEAKKILGLPLDKKIILFGAVNSINDTNKGFQYLKKAFDELATSHNVNTFELVVFGASKPKEPINFKFKTRYLGKVYDELSMAIIYSAADVFVAPSKSENLPNTVMEALACGTPCVAFDVGGMSDLIKHKENGFLAPPFDSAELSRGIKWVLSEDSTERRDKLIRNARDTIRSHFDIEVISRKYLELYSEILNQQIE